MNVDNNFADDNQPRPLYQNKQQDNFCLELILFCAFTFLTKAMWTDTCSFFFNTYCLTSYTLIVCVRAFQNKHLANIESNKKLQALFVGCIVPVFYLHTVFGGVSFFQAD